MSIPDFDAVKINGRTLTDAQAERFRTHSREALNGKAWANKIMEATGKRGLLALARELEAQQIADQADLDLSETLAIRHRMGDEVEGGAHGGRVTRRRPGCAAERGNRAHRSPDPTFPTRGPCG